MDPQTQASFIPKKPLTVGTHSGVGAGLGLFYLISIFIFVLSLVAAGASFAYTQYLKSALASKAHSLELAQGAYEPGAIQDLIRLDQRIVNAKALLARHIAPSAVFSLLSDETLEKVQFTTFDYEPADAEAAHIQLGGVADSFATLALQSDQFGASKALSDVVFSSIAVNSSGRVTFSVSATVDPSVLLYSKNLSQNTTVPEPELQGTTTTPTL